VQPDLLACATFISSHALEALSFTWQTLVANVHLFNRLASRIILLLQVYLALLSKQLALFFPQDKLDFQT